MMSVFVSLFVLAVIAARLRRNCERSAYVEVADILADDGRKAAIAREFNALPR
jgi:hypothetical protein